MTSHRSRSGNRLGTRWRGKLPIPQHSHPLVRFLFEEANRQMTTVTEIAERSGHRRCTVSDWRYRRQPGVADLDAALNVIGFELVARPKKDPQP
ncbi:hypothetical protein [Tianweitania sediminis]|uniref:Uncharacterized protein n=1 Tax=Tianweitania sediminis TaxID=1502156 RepID=A0A8J7ULI3_9HYPH|nr:hypothetical protein [Tianweitania sediminis]MBP0439462.1 hypothetical protein [Tianweitania sediminis]